MAATPCSASPRWVRATRMLSDATGWVDYRELGDVAGASNVGALVQSLRRNVTGYDGLVSIKVAVADRDGRTCKPGRCRLEGAGRERALAWLASVGA